MIHIDFETRSTCDIKRAGAYKYAKDPTTQVMCVSFRGSFGVEFWHRAHPAVSVKQSPLPDNALACIAFGEELEAHNAFFERCIWKYALLREFPDIFPEVDDDQWRCSLAKASTFCVPRKLENAAKALRLPVQKDMAGHRIMLKLCKPRKPRKAEKIELIEKGIDPDSIILWHEDPNDLESNWNYCEDDTATEQCLSDSLRPLSKLEHKLWQLDQKMNLKGVQVDLELCHAAVKMAELEKAKHTKVIYDLSNGEITTPTQRARIKEWVNSRGANLPDLKSTTVEKILLSDTLKPDVAQMLTTYRSAGRTSTAKYQAAIDQATEDGRVRDILLYHGAGTGRWTGKGLQIHNFSRGYGPLEDGPNEMEEVCEDIKTLSGEDIKLIWGDVMKTLAHSTRGIVIAPEGRDLILADFSAIEARVLMWYANEERALDLFANPPARRDGGKLDVYIDMATSIYNIPEYEVGFKERFMGKQAILGLGFMMGGEKFDDACFLRGVTDQPRSMFEQVVEAYRSKYTNVVKFWNDIEEAAMEAVQTREDVVQGKLKWGIRGRFLHCRLPSGRLLSFGEPLIKTKRTWVFKCRNLRGRDGRITVSTKIGTSPKFAWQLAKKNAEKSGVDKVLLDENDNPTDRYVKHTHYFDGQRLTHMSVDKRGKWSRRDTYGGMLTENVVQGAARDLLAHSMINVDEAEGYDLLMTVHDETVAEVDEGVGSVEEFEKLMVDMPEWAKDIPIEAVGWRGKRYCKV